MVQTAINFNDPNSAFTFEETEDAYKICIQPQCRRNDLAVEVEGKKTVRIIINKNGAARMDEVLMTGSVKLKDTAAHFDGGKLTVTVPKRARRALLGSELKKTSRLKLDSMNIVRM